MVSLICEVCGISFSWHRTKSTCSVNCRCKLQGKRISGENHFKYINGIATNREYECRICGIKFMSDKGHEGRIPKFCSRQCTGKSLIVEKKAKVCPKCGQDFIYKYGRKQQIYCSRKCSSQVLADAIKNQTGKMNALLSHLWKDGKTKIPNSLRSGKIYDDWRKAVLKRDNYTCQICGISGVKMQADHIKMFAIYPELRFDIDNGRALCKNCHKKTDTYGSKAHKEVKEYNESRQVFVRVGNILEYNRLIQSLKESKIEFDIIKMELDKSK